MRRSRTRRRSGWVHTDPSQTLSDTKRLDMQAGNASPTDLLRAYVQCVEVDVRNGAALTRGGTGVLAAIVDDLSDSDVVTSAVQICKRCTPEMRPVLSLLRAVFCRGETFSMSLLNDIVHVLAEQSTLTVGLRRASTTELFVCAAATCRLLTLTTPSCACTLFSELSLACRAPHFRRHFKRFNSIAILSTIMNDATINNFGPPFCVTTSLRLLSLIVESGHDVIQCISQSWFVDALQHACRQLHTTRDVVWELLCVISRSKLFHNRTLMFPVMFSKYVKSRAFHDYVDQIAHDGNNGRMYDLFIILQMDEVRFVFQSFDSPCLKSFVDFILVETSQVSRCCNRLHIRELNTASQWIHTFLQKYDGCFFRHAEMILYNLRDCICQNVLDLGPSIVYIASGMLQLVHLHGVSFDTFEAMVTALAHLSRSNHLPTFKVSERMSLDHTICKWLREKLRANMNTIDGVLIVGLSSFAPHVLMMMLPSLPHVLLPQFCRYLEVQVEKALDMFTSVPIRHVQEYAQRMRQWCTGTSTVPPKIRLYDAGDDFPDCPIGLHPISCAVVADDGITYELTNIFMHLWRNSTPLSPMSRTVIARRLTFNRTLSRVMLNSTNLLTHCAS